MASTRSSARTRPTARTASRETPGQAILALLRHGARIQIAACATAAKTLTEWVQATDRLAQAVGDELLRGVNRETDSAELVSRVSAAAGDHLRELTALPRTAADHFDARLARIPITTRRFR